MAYVMNPYSYKLGYSLSWSDDWFSNKKLYPVILQIMLTIRYFLIFFWTRRKMEKLDTYLSHINLTLQSGRLLIILFFYEAKMNKPQLNKYHMLKSVIKSIPYSISNKEFLVDRYSRGHSLEVRTKEKTASSRFFFVDNTKIETIEAQRFYLFFFFLGLDPGTFLLEFYLRFSAKFKKGSKPMKYVISNKHFSRGQTKKFVHELELTLLSKIYKFLNEKVFFFWLYDKEKNLNMVRFLRSLFFYGGMAYFGNSLKNLTLPYYLTNELNNNYKKSINLKKKKIKNNIYKNKNYFKKIRLITYCSLLNIDWKTLVKCYKKNQSKKSLYKFLKLTLLSLKVKSPFFTTLKKVVTENEFEARKWNSMSLRRLHKIKYVYLYQKEKKFRLSNGNYFLPSFSFAYQKAQIGSTKLDNWSHCFFTKNSSIFRLLCSKFGFNKNWRKQEFWAFKRYHFYRLFFNFFGNFTWNYNMKFLRYRLYLSSNISRYVFFKNKYNNIYNTNIKNKLLQFKKINKILLKKTKYIKLLKNLYGNLFFFNKYFYWQNKLKLAYIELFYIKRSSFWKYYTNFWDFKKLYLKSTDTGMQLLEIYTLTENHDLIKLVDTLLELEIPSWKQFDYYNSVFNNFLKAKYFVKVFEMIMNKLLQYKKINSNYKLGFLKKKSLLKKKDIKYKLFWKIKYWKEFKTKGESNQKKGEFLMTKYNILNAVDKIKIKKKNRLFYYNAGFFNFIEQNSVFIKNWYNLNKKKKIVNIFIPKTKNIVKDININNEFLKKNKKKFDLVVDNKRKHPYYFLNGVENKKINENYFYVKNVDNIALYTFNYYNKISKFNKKTFLNKRIYNLLKKNYTKKQIKFLLKNNNKLLNIYSLKINNLKINNNVKQKNMLKFLSSINYLKKLKVNKRKKIVIKLILNLFSKKKKKKK